MSSVPKKADKLNLSLSHGQVELLVVQVEFEKIHF